MGFYCAATAFEGMKILPADETDTEKIVKRYFFVPIFIHNFLCYTVRKDTFK